MKIEYVPPPPSPNPPGQFTVTLTEREALILTALIGKQSTSEYINRADDKLASDMYAGFCDAFKRVGVHYGSATRFFYV